jgi:hypothetical protein
MGRQFRSPRVAGKVDGGSFREFVGPVPGSSSAVANLSHPHTIPAYGVTNISTWAASTYFMAPPVEGALKTIVSYSSGSAVRWIKASTGATVNVGGIGGSASTANTSIIFSDSTVGQCLTLLGLNSTMWAIVSVYPALNSTAIDIRTT